MQASPVQLFLKRADRQPDREAVRAARAWSYGELATLSASVASYLLEHGLEPGDRVAMALGNSAEYVAIYFGTQLAGGAIVPLNVADKSRTLRRQAEHCGVKFFFVGSEHADLCAPGEKLTGTQYVEVGSDSSEWSGIVAANPSWEAVDSPLRADGLALILYTSGTTGRPKGVMLSHDNLMANMRSILDVLPIEADDRCLTALPFYHSFGNSLLTTHLGTGAGLVLQNHLAFPKQVLDRIKKERITALYGVPLTFALLLGKAQPEHVDVPDLRYVAQAGGAMPRSQIQWLRRLLPSVDIFVMYGQTEATARLTYLPADMLEQKLGSAGKAIPDVEIQIRDAAGQWLPAGAGGEIWARGPNVMMGYWNAPEASSAVLRDGWLWTRDYGRLDEDGYLYIEGRSSDMIKTGANRVSPDEVEEAILLLDGVAGVGVTAVADDVLGQAVFAAILPAPGATLTVQAIKAHCLEMLAPYKVPKRVVLVDDLPRTSSGKVKRHLLTEYTLGVKDQ